MGEGTAATAVGTVTAAALSVAVSMLIVQITLSSATINTLAFHADIQNPDHIALRAELTDGADLFTLDATESSFLLFEGLAEGTEYTLRINKEETGEELFSKTYMTAVERKAEPRFYVEDADFQADGQFHFTCHVDNLPEQSFYTLRVMDADGNRLFVADSTDSVLYVSGAVTPRDSWWTLDTMPYAVVRCGGKDYPLKIWTGVPEPPPWSGQSRGYGATTTDRSRR